ncbi:MAG: deoxyribose-phosphate aldolase [Planctomycetota bacterium]|nr:MAG: deoxyribose-phosphate aldolase [Planctomycetota bacterium]
MKSETLFKSSPPVDAIMVKRRAASFTTRSIKNSTKSSGLRLAMSMLDLTTLEGKDSPEKVRALCAKAICPHISSVPLKDPVPHVAAVCVYPMLVPTAKQALVGHDIKIAAVATGFPSGQYPLDIRLKDVRAAVEAGADEIDMVVSRGLFLAGQFDVFQKEIVETKDACGPAHLKIILETGELETLDNARRASDLAINALWGRRGAKPISDGEVFIKTSTGKIQPAATMPVTLVMLEAIRDTFLAGGPKIGMKPAGGIRTAKQALHYLVMVKETLGDAWLTPNLFRFGASSLANDILRQILKIETGHYAASWDLGE